VLLIEMKNYAFNFWDFMLFYAFSWNSYSKINNPYIKEDQKRENYAFLEHNSSSLVINWWEIILWANS
jgi:hypothetical protein